MLSVMIAPPNVDLPHTGRLVLPLLTPVTTVWGHVVVSLLMKLFQGVICQQFLSPPSYVDL